MNDKPIKPKAPPNRRNTEGVLDGIKGRITFHDPVTGYIRIESGNRWKAQANVKDLTPLEDYVDVDKLIASL